MLREASVSPHKQAPVCLLDASVYIFRYYFAMPNRWFSLEGQQPTAAVYGYLSFLLRFLTQQQPMFMAAAYDESLGSCFRNELYADYKTNRALPDEDLMFQLARCQDVTDLLGIHGFASPVYEADDLIGSLAAFWQVRAPKQPLALLTRDKDLGQLLKKPQDFLWDYTDEHKQERIDREGIHEKFGVKPEQLADYLALVGDAVDHIPGVPGVGAKTAQVLLEHFVDVEAIFGNLGKLDRLPIRGGKSLSAKLVRYTEQILMARTLTKIVEDVPLIDEFREVQVRSPDVEGLKSLCLALGFGTALHKKIDQYHAVYLQFNRS